MSGGSGSSTHFGHSYWKGDHQGFWYNCWCELNCNGRIVWNGHLLSCELQSLIPFSMYFPEFSFLSSCFSSVFFPFLLFFTWDQEFSYREVHVIIFSNDSFFFFNSLFLEIEPKWFSCLLIKNEWKCFSFLSQGTKVACEAIRKRIDAIKSEELKKDSEKEMSWEQLVKICHLRDVDLCERYWYDGVVLYYRVL